MAEKKKQQKKLNHKQFFGLLLFCLTLLVYTTCYMLQNGGITYESVLGTAEDVLPYCILIGLFGYIIGSILDNPKRAKIQETNDVINKYLQEAKTQAAQAAHDAKVAADEVNLSDEIGLKIDTEADI